MKIAALLTLTILLASNKGNSSRLGENITTTFSGDGLADNLTLTGTCAVRTVAVSHLTPYSTAVTNLVKAFRLIYFPPLFIFGILLNSLVIYLVARYKKLQILSFVIVLQVMAANILTAVFFLLPLMVTTIAGRWVLGNHMCVVTGFFTLFLFIMRTCLMLVFITDRFLSVFFPFFYLRNKVKIAINLSVFAWVYITIIRTASLPGLLDCIGFLTALNTCSSSSSCNGTCSIYGLLFFPLVSVPVILLSITLYTTLYCKARRLQKTTTTTTTGVDASTSKEERERERRVTITYFLLFLTIFVVTLPTAATQIVISRLYPSDEGPRPPAVFVVRVVVGGLVSLLLVIDPLVIMRNKDMLAILSEWRASLAQRWSTLTATSRSVGQSTQ